MIVPDNTVSVSVSQHLEIESGHHLPPPRTSSPSSIQPAEPTTAETKSPGRPDLRHAPAFAHLTRTPTPPCRPRRIRMVPSSLRWLSRLPIGRDASCLGVEWRSIHAASWHAGRRESSRGGRLRFYPSLRDTQREQQGSIYQTQRRRPHRCLRFDFRHRRRRQECDRDAPSLRHHGVCPHQCGSKLPFVL